ncbi:hypothetical protein D3C80_878010 [compost metagenome]
MKQEIFWYLITLLFLCAGLYCAFNGGYLAGGFFIAAGTIVGLANLYIEELRFKREGQWLVITIIRKEK